MCLDTFKFHIMFLSKAKGIEVLNSEIREKNLKSKFNNKKILSFNRLVFGVQNLQVKFGKH